MSKPSLFAATMLTAAFLAGCDQSAPTPPTPPTRPAAEDRPMGARPPRPPMGPMTTNPPLPPATTNTPDALDRASDAADDMTGAADDAATDIAADRNDATTRARTLLEQLLEYIRDNKLDQAETTLSQLDAMKASLPKATQDQIDSARATLTAKKAASGEGMPSLPALDGTK